MDYRYEAKKSLQRAKLELDSDDQWRARYAALELRMALESLIYAKSENYKDELTKQELETWQPRRLLRLLLEIDPYADKNSQISIGKEEFYGQPAKEMKHLGSERVLSLKEIKTHYDRLGSFLHSPTSAQLSLGKVISSTKIKDRCNEICTILEEVFSSTIMNSDFKVTSETKCSGCGERIVRRMPQNEKPIVAKCRNCNASYTVTSVNDGKVSWKSNTHDVKCMNQECEEKRTLWEREMEVGRCWKCEGCGGTNQLCVGISFTKADGS